MLLDSQTRWSQGERATNTDITAPCDAAIASNILIQVSTSTDRPRRRNASTLPQGALRLRLALVCQITSRTDLTQVTDHAHSQSEALERVDAEEAKAEP